MRAGSAASAESTTEIKQMREEAVQCALQTTDCVLVTCHRCVHNPVAPAHLWASCFQHWSHAIPAALLQAQANIYTHIYTPSPPPRHLHPHLHLHSLSYPHPPSPPSIHRPWRWLALALAVPVPVAVAVVAVVAEVPDGLTLTHRRAAHIARGHPASLQEHMRAQQLLQVAQCCADGKSQGCGLPWTATQLIGPSK